jgi:hypothetical protein
LGEHLLAWVRGFTESDFVILIGKCSAHIETMNWARSGKLKVSVMALIYESDSNSLQTGGDEKVTVARVDWQIEARLLGVTIP